MTIISVVDEIKTLAVSFLFAIIWVTFLDCCRKMSSCNNWGVEFCLYNSCTVAWIAGNSHML